jgi:hypothetical protein
VVRGTTGFVRERPPHIGKHSRGVLELSPSNHVSVAQKGVAQDNRACCVACLLMPSLHPCTIFMGMGGTVNAPFPPTDLPDPT